jgi:hypothetical protein
MFRGRRSEKLRRRETRGVMDGTMRLPTALLLLVVALPAAHARHAAGRAARADRRAPARPWRQPSPGGLHVAAVDDGALYVDGRPVRAIEGVVEALVWRADGGALAWRERAGRALRLLVLPDLEPTTQPLVWDLPPAPGANQIYWAAANRVVVGSHVFAPRAIASWD